MLRWNKDALKISSLFLVSALCGYYLVDAHSKSDRYPAAASDWSQSDFDHATLSVSMSEFQNSRPSSGRSYFDLLFSDTVGNQTKYNIPYPFTQVIAKIEDYMGQQTNAADSSGPKVVIFPMGRSLQRNAAVAGLNQAFSFDPFFRYPRIVVGVDEEPTIENALLLNLKNKLYIGFNERAQILEAISYNESEGRYEYQIIRDYAEGKVAKVVYANRSLCLSCHQNQTPIFSRGPWSESNANTEVSGRLKEMFDKTFGAQACGTNKNMAYCYRGSEPYYYGAPIHVDESVSYKFDTSTDNANLIHAFQKMWKELCTTDDCRSEMLRAILQYRLTGSNGLVINESLHNQLNVIESGWQNKYVGGMSIPSPNVPNRDPLKDISTEVAQSAFSTVSHKDQKSVQDLLAQSKIPTEFEPLLPRQALDIWKDSGKNVTNTNRLIRGFAQEFTKTDIRLLDNWLVKNKSEQSVVAELVSDCQLDQDSSSIAISCQGNGTESFSLNTYLKLKGQKAEGEVSDFSLQSKALNCNPAAPHTDANIYQGISCPQMSVLKGGYYKANDQQAVLFLQRPEGISYRTFQGYYAAEIFIDLKSNKAKLKVYDQNKDLTQYIAQFKKEFFKTNVFSRFQVMQVFAKQMELSKKQNIDVASLELTVDGETSGQNTNSLLEAGMSGQKIMQNVCTICHRNDEAVPPNFMGLASENISDYDQCRRIEQCAARMIYRLKMRNCEQTEFQKKKNPMPPEFFLKNSKMTSADWMKTHNPKVLQFLNSLVSESELSQDLSTHGLPASEAQKAAADILKSNCPTSNSVIYDQLPKCEFNQLKPMTRCH